MVRHRPRIHRALVAPGTGPRCGLGAASDAAQALSSGARHFRAGPSAHVPRCGAATGHACLAADNADWRDRLAASAVVAGTRGDPLVAVRFRHVRAVRHSKDGRGHGLAFVYKGPDGARGARADDDYRRPGAGREAPRHRLDHRLMADFARIYARQERLTPGAAETVEIIAQTVQPTERSLLLDVACGKGEAAATLAGRFACRILAVEVRSEERRVGKECRSRVATERVRTKKTSDARGCTG